MLAVVCLALAACAGVDFDTGGRELAGISPAAAAGGDHAGAAVVWGGEIVGVRNEQNYTELQVLSYPLSTGHVPRTNREPGPRFVLRFADFLEPVEYAPGRFVSAFGTVGPPRAVQVGGRELVVASLEAEQLHLWPADRSRWQRRVNFGVGVGIHL